MKIEFEWHTTKISDDNQKKEAETELRNKIEHHYDQIIEKSASILIVSLFDKNPDYLITGTAVSFEEGETKEVIKNITYNPGIHLEFITH